MTIVINGTTGISGVDGSAGTPAVQGTDTNTGVFFPAADTIAFTTGGTEDMRIDSSGNVGIGTSSPSSKLNLADSANSGFVSTLTFSANNSLSAKADYVQFKPSVELNTSGGEAGGYTLQIKQQGAYKNSIVASGVTNNSSNYLAFSTTNEAMRIDSSGNLLFNSGYGSVATAYGCRAWVNFNGTGTVAIRASGNVTSITDNGTGDYTVNFTNAMPDVNFSGTVSGSGGVNGQHCPVFLGAPGTNDTSSHPTTSAFRFSFYNVTNSTLRVDQTMINAAIFR